MPPASFISFTASWAAFLQDSPTAGISPVNSAITPTLIVEGLFSPQPAAPRPTRKQMHHTRPALFMTISSLTGISFSVFPFPSPLPEKESYRGASEAVSFPQRVLEVSLIVLRNTVRVIQEEDKCGGHRLELAHVENLHLLPFRH